MSDLPSPEFDRPLESCPMCGSASIRPYDRDFRGISISRCGQCGVKFMNPQYTDAYLSAFYACYITPERPFGAGPEYAAIEQRRRIENYEAIERHVAPGRLLSIGCGDGLELQVGRSRGWSVEGYDVDPATTERIARELGIPVHTGDLRELGLPDNAYDCVYLDQVLEHPKQPGATLRVARRLLRPGGVLFVGCPNIMSLASATKLALERLGVRRRHRGRHYDTRHHLFYYSPGMLRRLLERQYGFRVLSVRGDPLIRKKTYPNRFYVAASHRFPWIDSTFQLLAAKSTEP